MNLINLMLMSSVLWEHGLLWDAHMCPGHLKQFWGAAFDSGWVKRNICRTWQNGTAVLRRYERALFSGYGHKCFGSWACRLEPGLRPLVLWFWLWG